MPSSFATGLTSGLVQGWTQQVEKQDQVKRQEQQRNIENNLAIMNSRDVPDDVRSNAAQQLQDLMQGKKPGGKGGGQLSPVLQNLLKMIGKSHGDQGQQKPGGWTENLPNGQAAPGTAGSQPGLPAPPPTNTNPQTGRPSLQGTGNAATDPANSPVPAASPTPGAQGGGSTLDQMIAREQAAVQSEKNPYTRARHQERLDKLMDEKVKNEATEGLEEKRETGREALERAKADAAKALQDLKDKSAKDIAEAKLQGAKEEKEARAKADKDLEDQKEKNREALKKVIPGKAAGSGGGSKPLTPYQKAQIEGKKDDDLKAAEKAYSTAIENIDTKQGGTVAKKVQADALDALKKAKAAAQSAYENRIKAATGSGGGTNVPAGRVKVTAPNGSEGHIPASQLDEWDKMTPEQQNQATQKKAA